MIGAVLAFLKFSPGGLLSFLISNWRPLLILAGAFFLALYCIKIGEQRVQKDWDKSVEAQRGAAAAQSANYQKYRKDADMTNIRKEMANEIRNGTCIVRDGNWLQLYKAAGVRNHTR